MIGKNKCRILKEIRKKIADENDIPLVTHECRYQGECSGTCPKCERELQYLERQLAARAAAGKRVAIAAACAGLVVGITGCTPSKTGADTELGGAPELAPTTEWSGNNRSDGFELARDVVYVEESPPK